MKSEFRPSPFTLLTFHSDTFPYIGPSTTIRLTPALMLILCPQPQMSQMHADFIALILTDRANLLESSCR